mmetsp:Transcript_8146/g.15357  ORF Transcript_8146/g.15357 Transcript_8146/m.15357 type:complete len:759 (-) Transcript_8146:314-2590(-)
MIAQALHREMSMSKVDEELRHLRIKSTEQTNQIRELFAREQLAASKAELHAVMASLTYKNRAEGTSDALGRSIQQIFDGNRRGQNPEQQNKEIQAFLANPYESIAVLADKIGKIEAQHAEERRSTAQEVEKLQGELAKLRSGNEDLNFQVFKMQTSMSKSSRHQSVSKASPRPPTLVAPTDSLDSSSVTELDLQQSEQQLWTELGSQGEGSHQDSREARECRVEPDGEDERDDEETRDRFADRRGSRPTADKHSSPMGTVLPGLQRTSTIRLPNREGPVLQRLQDYEARTDKRLNQLEASDVIVRKLMSATEVLNEEHESFHKFKTDASAQMKSQQEHFQSIIKHLVVVVEQCVGKVDKVVNENLANQLLTTQVEDIRRDLHVVIQETMRAAKPEENGIVFKSMSLVEPSTEVPPSTMMSKEVPGIEDVKALIEGLKVLDGSFKQSLQVVEKLSKRQEGMVKDVSSVEDNLQKLKYLVLHSIQLPTKPSVPSNREEPPPAPKPPAKHNRLLEGQEVKLDRPMSSSACKGGMGAAARVLSAPSSAQNKRGHTAPSPSPAVDKFSDEDFFSGGNFEIAENFVGASTTEDMISRDVPKETPPVGACPSHLRSQGSVRKKRQHGVDLVKGIASTRRRGAKQPSGSSSKARLAAGVNEDTLRKLALEWGSDTADRIKGDDWSRTIDETRSTTRKRVKQQSPAPPISEQHSTGVSGRRGGAVNEDGNDDLNNTRPDGTHPRLLDSSASKDFMSIMSSITDVDIA